MSNQFNFFYANNAMLFLQKCKYYCKSPKNPHAFFIFPKKSFIVFNRAPSHTLKVFFGKIFYYFFNVHKMCFLHQFKNFIIPIHRCCHKILFISVKYFRICIIKSFMRSRFCLTTLYVSHVTCHFFVDKVVELVGGGSVINGAYPV